MTTPGQHTPHQQAADELLAALTRNAPGRELEVAARLEELAARASGMRMQILARATAAASQDLKVLPVADQIHASNRHTRKAAQTDVRLAMLLETSFSVIGDAWTAGTLSEAQARAIIAGLRHYPTWLSNAQLEQCQHELVAYAASFDPNELRVLAQRMIETIDPESADTALADRVEREARLAFERRYLTITPDHHGSMIIRGQIPVTDGELLLAQLDALTPSAASYDIAPTRPARRADALARLTQLAANTGELPTLGADRPTVIVTMNLADLKAGLATTTLISSGENLTANEARRLACDANLIPAVLGTHGEPLDVGRTRRLFTGPLRTALILRDQGCAFPGCNATPNTCEAHHIKPWQNGGQTSLGNGILLCPFHHRIIEPDPNRPPEHNWAISLDQAGDPWFIPPRQVDLRRRPRQHHRYQLKGRTLPTTRPSEPPWLPVQARLPQPSLHWVATR